MEEFPPNNLGTPSSQERIKGLEGVILEYKNITSEIREVVGNGEAATDVKGLAERRADFKRRELLDGFLESFPNKEELPEFIDLEKDPYPGRHDKKYLFPREKLLYSVSSGPEDLPSLVSEADKDDSFFPENPNFRGIDIVFNLIKQNENSRHLMGLYVQGAEPRLSEKKAISLDIPEHELHEKIGNNELRVVFAKIGKSIVSLEGKELFKEFQNFLREIEEEQRKEQEEAEIKYAKVLKNVLMKWANEVEQFLGEKLPDKIPLRDKDDFNTELGMVKLGDEMRKTFKKGEREVTPKKSDFLQIYFYPHDGKMELVPVKKSRFIGRWEDDESDKREATPQEFIDKRMYVKHKLTDMIPREIRLDLPIP